MGFRRVGDETDLAVVGLQDAHLGTFVQVSSYGLRDSLQANAAADLLYLGDVVELNLFVDHVFLPIGLDRFRLEGEDGGRVQSQ